MGIKSKEKLLSIIGLTGQCELRSIEANHNYQFYRYSYRQNNFTILRERGRQDYYIKLEDDFAIAMGYKSHLHMMSKDRVIVLMDYIQKTYGRWIFKRVVEDKQQSSLII
ncbi:hypothetical protein ACP6L2_03820 [Sphingobacterium lactis]|uniref:hypothetical protein n=1 Tax=Sphingobacterium lactis TaxID=797291 RepID=UPI003F8136FD